MWSQDYCKLWQEISENKLSIPGVIEFQGRNIPVLVRTDSTGRHTIGSTGCGFENIRLGDEDGTPEDFFVSDCKSLNLWWAYPPAT